MNTDTKVYLKKRFKDYYWRNEVAAPSEVHRREFGVGTLEDKIKFRHKGFANERELNQYLKTEAPYYISYSTAYYEFPRQPMQSKNWLGADLIFDLDKSMDYLDAVKLDEVKDEAVSLVEFLEGDFGFQRKDISVNFSGSKGYHVHVMSDDVRLLNGDARREIVDYITATGLDVRYFINEVEVRRGYTFKRRGIQETPGRAVVGPGGDSRGWAGRLFRVAKELINSTADELERLEGVGPKKAERLVLSRDINMKLLAEGKWEALFDQLGRSIQRQIYSKAVAIKDEDRQVTIDTSRLIRLPDTIHGGSGLIAKRVVSLEGFNPLTDAVAFGDSRMEVKVTSDVGVFQMFKGDFGPYKSGTTVELESSAAVYLMLKDKADAVSQTSVS